MSSTFTQFSKAIFLAGIFSLSACSVISPTREQVPGIGFIGGDKSNSRYGTYVQWNAEYAVTAGHTGPQKNTVYISKNLDIQFLRISDPTPGLSPTWNFAKFGERLVMKGYAQTNPYQIKQVEGVAVNYPLIYRSSKAYQLIDAPIIHGMSGGPVINSQQEVVGILIGNTVTPIKTIHAEPRIHSLYLPYAEIKKEFDIFMSEKSGATPQDKSRDISQPYTSPKEKSLNSKTQEITLTNKPVLTPTPSDTKKQNMKSKKQNKRQIKSETYQ